jgi:putative peptidoglycan lipid II flippase
MNADRAARSAGRDAAPAERGTRSAGRGAVPADRGAAPAERGTRSAGRGAVPAERGAMPDLDRSAPPAGPTARASRGAPAHGSEPVRTGRAAALIGAITAASRITGFARILVFVLAVGSNDLGDMYQTANTIPNIVFEIVAGGALASLVVPLLARAVAAGDRAGAAETTSALLCWVLVLLCPVALVVALAAEPIVRLLARDATAPAVSVGVDMLRVFAPQLPLYGVGIVLTGVLQSYRRFAWPVLAPLLSSLTVMAAYGLFALVTADQRGTVGGRVDAAHVGRPAVLVLSVGTTLGVVVLSMCLLIPLRAVRLPLRPRLRFEAQAAASVRRLAAAGALTVAAQQLALALTIALANDGPEGSVVLFGLAQTVYLLPWAVLSLPIATSAYPALAQAAAHRDEPAYAGTLAPAARGLVLLAWFGAAALVVLAGPLAGVLAPALAGGGSPRALAAGVAGFAPGLVGYALFALLTRALYARGNTRHAAAATVAGWSAAAASSVLLALALPETARVAALSLGNSAGMLLLGGVLVVAVIRRAGRAALAGIGRTFVAGLAAALLGTGAGLAVLDLVWRTPPLAPTPAVGTAIVQGMLSLVAVTAVFATVLLAADRRDVRTIVAGVARRVPGRRGPAPRPGTRRR